MKNTLFLLVSLILIAGSSSAQQQVKPHRRTKGGPAEPVILKYVEQQAAFRGDATVYVNSMLRYPEDAREYGMEGRAEVLFEIRADGSVRYISMRRSTGFATLDAEARRVVSAMPAWKPQRIQGTARRCLMILPVVFRLN